MKKLKIVILFLFLIVISNCTILPPKLPATENIRTPADLDAYLQNLVMQGDPPGLSIVVTKNAKSLYKKGFGFADKPFKKKASPETVYQWWSLTKPVTAVAILQLNEQGKLKLNDPVEKYLSFFKPKSAHAHDRKVQIKDLLSHSSGLGDIGMKILGWIHYDGDPHLNQTELLKRTLPDHLELNDAPGVAGHYSNLAFIALAAVIEKVSGLNYEDYVRLNVLNPLGMNNTDFVYTDSMKKVEATGSHPVDFMSILAFMYIDKDKAIREKTAGRYWFNHVYSDQNGPTGLIGSALDYSKFLVSLIDKSSPQILSPESINLMFNPVVDVDSNPMGAQSRQKFSLGWFYLEKDGRTYLAHGGAGAAFVCVARIYPEESLSIVVMSNSTYLGRSMGDELVNKIANIQWK